MQEGVTDMRRIRLAAAATGVALLLGACSSKSTTNSTAGTDTSARLVSLVHDARTKSIDQKTATYSETVVATPQTGTATSFLIAGQMDFANHLYSTGLTIPGLGLISGILDGTVIYVQMPSVASALIAKPWVKIDPTTLKNVPAGPLASLFGSLQSLARTSESQDPSQGLSMLAGAVGPITNVGPENVSGTATTHYKFTVDVNKAFANLPADAKATLEALLGQLGITTLPGEAWIDSQGRVRRVHEVITANPSATASPVVPGLPAAAIPKTADVTVDITDYGAPVSIKVPPPDQVTDFGAMMGRLESPSP